MGQQKRTKKNDRNDSIWDSYWQAYQQDSLIPGVSYPNEHLVRFMMDWKRSHVWTQNHRPKVLELGFGNITNMLMLHENGFDVEGLEVSRNSVERASAALKKIGIEDSLGVDTYSGPEIPKPENSFDAVIGLQCVYYNLDQNKFAEECSRILKPGGLLFLSFFSPRHGYMKYIEGQPGSKVRFKNNHPNPRLAGLTLFLYKDELHFEETYGKYFFIKTGVDEFDMLPIFQSWYYLRGQKKDVNPKDCLQFPLSSAENLQLHALESDPEDTNSYLEQNISIWDKYFQGLPEKKPYDGQRYPDEQVVRYLATWKRRKENDYFSNIGREDNNTKVPALKALEINFLNPVHQKVMLDFEYKTYGVTYSPEALNRGKNSVAFMGLEKDVELSYWDGKSFDYKDDTFDLMFSLKAAYYQPNQEQFIKECARTIKQDGEICFYYLSPRHGYCKYVERIANNIYRFTKEHPNPKFIGLNVFLADKQDLKKLWSSYFDIEVKYFEFNNYPVFSSFYVVIGTRK